MQVKHWILLVGVLLLMASGCGQPENKVTFPENPEPMPPEDVQLQQLDANTSQQTFESEGGPSRR